MTEPTTEAGRRALANVQPDYEGPWLRDILAILDPEAVSE